MILIVCIDYGDVFVIFWLECECDVVLILEFVRI